ncbi:MAG: hypothetical protein WA003_15555 [Desulfuromonadaceae bacterium]
MSVVSGIKGADAAENAADTQAQSAAQANETQWQMYQQSRADQMPWLVVGEENLGNLNAMVQDGPGDFKDSEYYNQGLDEANRATDTYLASRGLYASGKAAKDLQKTAVAVNENNRGNWLNEWIATKLNPTQSLAGVGQSAAAGMSANALNTGNIMGNNLMSAGNARASGMINSANAMTGASQGVANALSSYYGNKNYGTNTGSTGGGGATAYSTQGQSGTDDFWSGDEW